MTEEITVLPPAERGEAKRAGTDPFDHPALSVARFTMERDIRELSPNPALPFGYRLEIWCEPMLPAFAAAMAVSFADSSDMDVYPALGSRDGCIEILKEIIGMPDYIESASWMVFFHREPCGLILSGRSDTGKAGCIRVAGIGPRHRRVGIGSHLVNQAIWAFRDRNLEKALVTVNSSNRGAVMFFRALGFRVNASREYT